MGNNGRIEYKKRFVAVLCHEVKGCLMDEVSTVSTCFAAVVFVQKYLFIVVPEMEGIIVVCQPLAVVSIKLVKSLEIGISYGADESQSPLPKGTCCIASLTEHLSNRE